MKVLVVKGKHFFKNDPLITEVIEYLKSLGYEIEEYVYDNTLPIVEIDNLTNLIHTTEIKIVK